MKKIPFKLVILSISFSIVIVAIVTVYSMNQNNKTVVQNVELPVILHPTKAVDFEYRKFSTSMTLAAIGDILVHSTVYNDAKTNDTYDFSPMFANVADQLRSPDLTVANQETIIGGSEIGLSTYPSFNSPYELADTLKDVGVDIVTIANNHTLDRGEKAILNATNYFDEIKMNYVGGYRSEEDKTRIRVINRNGIDIAFLSYTYGTNGIPVPTGKEYLVNLIDMNQIKSDITDAKKVADVVSVSMHWGNEYQRLPSDQQVQMAQEIANEGADIIIGHHPHVLQPMGWLDREDGGQTFVIYSLGNFLSGQMWDYKDIGGIFEIEIVKEKVSSEDVNIQLINPTFTSTYVTNQNQQNFKIVPLKEAATVGLEDAESVFNEIEQHMFQWIVEDVN